MKNDAGSIPSDVFGWMEQYRFEELTTQQQQVVLGYFDAAEYDEMAMAAQALTMVARSPKPKGRDVVKMELLEAFDRKHPARAKFLNVQWGLGRVAALVLIFTSLLVAQYLHFRQVKTQLTGATRVDTLMVEATAPEPLLIRDTVYLRETGPTSAKRQTKQYRRASGPIPRNEGELHITGTDELDRLPNRPKRNSLGQDTLLNKYGFVSM